MSLAELYFLGGVGIGVLLGLCIASIAVHLLSAPAFWRRSG